MYYPKNILINNKHVTHYYTYDQKDFIVKGDIDLETTRLSAPLYINLELTMKCYTDCLYCYANRTMKLNKMMTLEQIKYIIDQAVHMNILKFDINGGEVLLHPQYKEIISYLLDNGFKPIISTKVPISRNKVKSLKEIGIKGIQISLDSANIETLIKLLKVNNHYIERMKDTLTSISKENMVVQINTVLTSLNSSLEEMENLINFLSEFQCVKKINFTAAGYSIYKPNEYLKYRTTTKFMQQLEKYLKKENKSHIITTINYGNTKEIYQDRHKIKYNKRALCTGNIRGMVILPDGRVTICEELYDHPDFIIGDLTKNTIDEVWNSPKAINLFNLKKKMISKDSACKKCSSFNDCRHDKGVCWKEVLMAYGYEKWDYPDPRCPQAPSAYNKIWIE